MSKTNLSDAEREQAEALAASRGQAPLPAPVPVTRRSPLEKAPEGDERCCGTCEVWTQAIGRRPIMKFDDVSQHERPMAQCRRHPPVAHAVDGSMKTLFPLTFDNWFCGDYIRMGKRDGQR